VDSDGNFEVLIPQMLEKIGMNILLPDGGRGRDWIRSDPRKFGRDVRMVGGVDKRIVASGKDAIKKEMERLFPGDG